MVGLCLCLIFKETAKVFSRVVVQISINTAQKLCFHHCQNFLEPVFLVLVPFVFMKVLLELTKEFSKILEY